MPTKGVLQKSGFPVLNTIFEVTFRGLFSRGFFDRFLEATGLDFEALDLQKSMIFIGGVAFFVLRATSLQDRFLRLSGNDFGPHLGVIWEAC